MKLVDRLGGWPTKFYLSIFGYVVLAACALWAVPVITFHPHCFTTNGDVRELRGELNAEFKAKVIWGLQKGRRPAYLSRSGSIYIRLWDDWDNTALANMTAKLAESVWLRRTHGNVSPEAANELRRQSPYRRREVNGCRFVAEYALEREITQN
jgi:hypothetical protein